MLYISTLIAPIRTLSVIYEEIQGGATGFKRFCEILDVPPEEESPNAVEPERLKGEIVFDNVSFGYSSDEGERVISGFSMKIPAGKTTALVGPSGGGKTTICHLIPRFYETDGGEITIDGFNVKDLKRGGAS